MNLFHARWLALLAACLWGALASAQQLIVFGDSISDGGNAALAVLFTGGQFEEIPYVLPPAGNDLDRVPGAPYNLDPSNPFAARFSNGPVWVEQLSARFGMLLLPSLAGGTNFAFGGADSGPLPGIPPDVIPTLRQQADQFLSQLNPAVGAPADALYVVFGGSNDVRKFLAIKDFRQLLVSVEASAGNIKGIVDDLVSAGARNIIVVLVPNVGLAPDVKQAGFRNKAAFAAAAIDGLLLKKLKPYLQGSQVNLKLLDSFTLVTRIVAQPEHFGIIEAQAPCVDFGRICTNPDDYLFWDGIHPTRKAHGILADKAQFVLAH